jgi:hypothetical protein
MRAFLEFATACLIGVALGVLLYRQGISVRDPRTRGLAVSIIGGVLLVYVLVVSVLLPSS